MTQHFGTLSAQPRPVAPRSGLVLRLLFAIVVTGIVVAGAAVAVLVSFAFFNLSDDSPPMANVRPQQVMRLNSPLTGDGAADVDVWDRHGPLNIMLLGLDVEDCLVPEGTYRRTDTIIIVRVDPQSRRAVMLTVPRDLYVSVPSHGYDGQVQISGRKINTAHQLGEADQYLPGGGPALAEQVIEENLGIPIHRYARVDFQGFKRIIDALDGVDIDIPPSPTDPSVGLYDPSFPDSQCGTIVVEFKPGPQHLSGDEALQYARSRKTTSDFDRSRRQMQVLLAIRDRATSLGMFLRLPDLVPALMDTVDTDFSPIELVSLASIARDIRPADIATFQIDASVVTDESFVIDTVPQAVLILIPQAFESVRQRFLSLDVGGITTNLGPEGAVNLGVGEGEGEGEGQTPGG